MIYLCYTLSKSAAGERVRLGAPGANSGLVVDDLASAIAAMALKGPSQASDIGRGLRSAFLKALVRVHPGAITTDDEALLLTSSHHASQSWDNPGVDC